MNVMLKAYALLQHSKLMGSSVMDLMLNVHNAFYKFISSFLASGKEMLS